MVGVLCLARLSFLRMDMDGIVGCRGVNWTLFPAPLWLPIASSPPPAIKSPSRLTLQLPSLHLISATHPRSFIHESTIYLFVVPLCRIPPRSLRDTTYIDKLLVNTLQFDGFFLLVLSYRHWLGDKL